MNTRISFRFLRFALGFVLVCTLTLGNVNPAVAALRCYVKADAGGYNDGTSWANAYINLQSVLGASSCTEVWVAAGTYQPTNGTDRTVSFVLKSGVAIHGGFAGSETLLTQRNPIANPTILSGDIGVSGNADNSYHVVVGSGTDITALLDGFNITAGNANGGSEQSGGGMYNYSGSPSLKNVNFSNNSATWGGGMSNSLSDPSLTNVTFNGNSATDRGGGMSNWQGNPTLMNVTFSGNSATSLGGGMENDGGSFPSLTNVTFNGNSAVGGGGMYNGQSNPTLVNVTFSGNSANEYGGGIYNSASSPIIKNSILYGDAGGEILNFNSSTPVVTYSVIQDGYPGTGNLNSSPLLGPLQYNGGFTQTMALGSGSPAIDNGMNAGCPLEDQRGITRPQDGDGNGTAICDMGAYESPGKLSLFSAGAKDGWVLESSETSGVGGTMNASQATFALGDDTADRQGRSILSFNTAGLPDNAIITSVVLKIRSAGVVGTNPFRTHGKLVVDVRRGAFSNNAALQLQDFQAAANKNGALIIKNNPVSRWYSGTMIDTNFTYINKLGVTQFRLRFAKDDNDDLGLDYIKFYSGNSILANRPQLIIQYYTP